MYLGSYVVEVDGSPSIDYKNMLYTRTRRVCWWYSKCITNNPYQTLFGGLAPSSMHALMLSIIDVVCYT